LWLLELEWVEEAASPWRLHKAGQSGIGRLFKELNKCSRVLMNADSKRREEVGTHFGPAMIFTHKGLEQNLEQEAAEF